MCAVRTARKSMTLLPARKQHKPKTMRLSKDTRWRQPQPLFLVRVSRRDRAESEASVGCRKAMPPLPAREVVHVRGRPREKRASGHGHKS